MKKMLSLILLVSCSVGMLSAMEDANAPHDGQKPPFDLAEAQRLAGEAYDFVSTKGKALLAEAEARNIPLGWIAAGVVLGYWSRGRFSPIRSAIVANSRSIENFKSETTGKLGDVLGAQKATHDEVKNILKLLTPQPVSPVKP